MLVYVHGNCQARAIAQMLAPVFPEWIVEYYEVFKEKIIDENERYHALVRDADIIIAQPINMGYRDREDLSIDWVRSTAKTSAIISTFPSMYFGGQLIGYNSCSIPAYPIEYHDTLLVKLLTLGFSVTEITDRLLSEDLYSDAFVEQEVSLSIAELQRREQSSTVDNPFSPFLERYGFDMQVFHTPNHPYRPALAWMANGILRGLGFPQRVPTQGEDHIRLPHIPCAPSTVGFFARRGNANPEWAIDEGDKYHLQHERLSRADYIARAVAHLQAQQQVDLTASLEDRRILPFLARAEATMPALFERPRQAVAVEPAPQDHRDLVMQFESLGGAGHGCEFGLFQREFGAEPLGLLRWADLGCPQLTAALKAEFAGVGEVSNTEVFRPPLDEWNEWWTRDKRYWMAMRSFIKTDQVTHERMHQIIATRQRFLREKLLSDLKAGEKIFVYKDMYKTLAPEDLKQLHDAVRAYGENVLLYIAYEDDAHPNGTVEIRAPGLLVGYIDHFGFSPKNERISSASAALLALCKKAFALRAIGETRERGDAADDDTPAVTSVNQGPQLARETCRPGDHIDLSNLPDKGARGLEKSHRVSYMVQGWIAAAQLSAKGGGTACLAIGCPDDFYAVRLGFPNITHAPWRLLKVIGRASSSFGDYVHPVGMAPWVTFAQALAVSGDEVTFPPPDAPSEITVAGLKEHVGGEQAPSFTWTGWAPIRSLEADPVSGLRVLMLRGLIPSEQTICYAAGLLRNLLGNKAENGGFECFTGGVKFDVDRVTVPDGPELAASWISNPLVNGSIFPMVQFLTKNPGQTGLLIGDSHQQGTSTTGQVTNFLYRAVVGAMQDNRGSRPLGFVNAAQGGLKSTQFFARLHAWIDAVRPSYVILPGWTYNDYDGQERADQATIERFFARLLGASDACTFRGAVPIFTTPFPRDARRMGPAQIGPWRWLRKEILNMRKTGAYVLDTSQLLSEFNADGLSGTYLPAFSTDAAHPNNAGHTAIAALVRSFLA